MRFFPSLLLPTANFFCKMEPGYLIMKRGLENDRRNDAGPPGIPGGYAAETARAGQSFRLYRQGRDSAEGIARELGFATRRTNKGNLIITVPGRETGRKVGLCAHVDTLGLMVRSITAEAC